jgi:hypothetical protein
LELVAPEPVPQLELHEEIPELAAAAEPEALPAIPLELAEPATPPPVPLPEAIPLAEAWPLEALPVPEPPQPSPPLEEDVPMARLAEPVEAEECELVEEDEEALTASRPTPRRDESRPRRRKRAREQEVELRKPLWMQPGQQESPLNGNRIVGGLVLLLGAVILLSVCAGGHLFAKSDYQAAYAVLFLLGLAMIVGGVIALIRG